MYTFHAVIAILNMGHVVCYIMNAKGRKGDRNSMVTCSLCHGGLSISTDADLKMHDEIWHQKNSISYFIRNKKTN
jgi:hypothetical protein